MGFLWWGNKANSQQKKSTQATAGTIAAKWARPPDITTLDWLNLFQSSPRLAALHRQAMDVANAEFKIFLRADLRKDADSAKPIVDHPLYNILEDPMPRNPEMDGFTLRYLTEVYLAEVGNGFWLKDGWLGGYQKGYPTEFYIIAPHWVQRTPTISYPFFLVNPFGAAAGTLLEIPQADVVWFKEPNVVDPYGRGVGRAQAIRHEISADKSAAEFQARQFYNDGITPFIAYLEGGDEVSVRLAKEAWRRHATGSMRSRDPFFTSDKMEIEKLNDSNREMDFNESRRLLRDFSNQFFNLPPELSGINESSNRSTIDAADYIWSKGTITRRLQRWENIFDKQILPDFVGGQKGVQAMKFDSVVPEDDEFDLAKSSQGVQLGLLTENEWRKVNGYKEQPDGNTRRVAFSTLILPVGQRQPVKPASGSGGSGTAPLAEQFPEGADDDTQDSGQNQQDGKGLLKSLTMNDARKILSQEYRKAIQKAVDETAVSQEPLFHSGVKLFATKQEAKVTRTFNARIKDGWDPESALDAALKATYGDQADAAVRDALAPAWASSMKAGFDHASDLLGGGLDFKLYQPAHVQWIDEQGLAHAGQINDTTKEQLSDSLSEGITAGLSNEDLAQGLKDVFGELTDARADLIARTESIASVNYGQTATYKQAGVKQKEWLATDDSATRQTHLDAQDAGPVGIDESFKVGDSEMDFPGDSSKGAGPDEVCNCFVPSTRVEGVFVAGSKFFYSGNVREIKTRSGKSLTVTVNHPILTSDGWVPAAELQEGQYAVSYSGDVGDSSLLDADRQNIPPMISDVFESLRTEGRAFTAKVVPLYFHGDGERGNGEIETILFKGVLPLHDKFLSLREQGEHVEFVKTGSGLLGVSKEGTFDQLLVTSLLSSDGVVSRSDLSSDSLGTLLDFGPLKALGVGRPAQWNTFAHKVAHERDSDDSGFFGKLIEASAGQVAFDEIIKIREYEFSDFVYDLQTVDHYILSNGIVSSNCRCTVLPVLDEGNSDD